MFLTITNIVHYLIERGLATAVAVVDGRFTAFEAGSRNRNYRIRLEGEPGLFVKQIQGIDAMAIATLQREAACYRLARDTSGWDALRSLMPRFVDHDPARHCLAVELLHDSESFNEYQNRTRQLPGELTRRLGAALGACHRSVARVPPPPEETAVFPRMPAWILSYHRSQGFPPGNPSGGTGQLAEIVRRYPDLHANLDRLHAQWRWDALIHGDMKWDNCLVCPDGAGGQTVKIVDWELADYGDACWDLGGVLQSYLISWIFSMPLHAERSPGRLARAAALPLEAMAPSIRAFWRGYREGAGLPAGQAAATLLRAVEYSAARLVQTAFESLYAAPAMTPHAATLLQVSLNVLRDPREAAIALYGLEAELRP
jgi:Ser/Thr protein kinase RdoA (MazF antagonist)